MMRQNAGLATSGAASPQHKEADFDEPIRDLLAAGRQQQFIRLVEQLDAENPRHRERAAGALADYAESAIEPLCRSLEDRNDAVRIAAVKSLASIGDSRAIPRLVAAAEKSFAGGSGGRHVQLRRQLLVFSALGPLVVVLALRALSQSPEWPLLLLPFPCAGFYFSYLVERLSHERFQRVAIEALVALGEKDPAPELGLVLPHVQALADDRVQLPENRRLMAEAAVRIAGLVDTMSDLPIPATEPTPDVAVLPTPANGRTAVSPSLPLPVTYEDGR